MVNHPGSSDERSRLLGNGRDNYVSPFTPLYGTSRNEDCLDFRDRKHCHCWYACGLACLGILLAIFLTLMIPFLFMSPESRDEHIVQPVLHHVALAKSHARHFASFIGVAKPKSPIILVNGDGGAQLEAKLNKTHSGHWGCYKQSDWFLLWIKYDEFVPYFQLCLIENLQLNYDAATHTTLNYPGVDIRTRKFGDPTGVEMISEGFQLQATKIYNDVANMLVNKMGYVRNKDLIAGQYDFRKAMNELQDYFVKLKALIEKEYSDNFNSKVTIVCHSYGNVIIHYFLRHQSAAWKEKYILRMISISPPWGGSMKTMRLLLTGWNLNIFSVSEKTVRPLQRSMPSTHLLLPASPFYNSSDVLVSRPGRNYTALDYKAIYEDAGISQFWPLRQDVDKLMDPLVHPGVDVYCLHGIGVPTLGKIDYATDAKFPDSATLKYTSDGDGTVPAKSLRGCLSWPDDPKHKVIHKEYKGAEHTSILHDPRFLVDLERILDGKVI